LPVVIDSCIVGNWKSTVSKLRLAQDDAAGGANVSLQIAASGVGILDFDAMSDIHALSKAMPLEYHYAGKLSGQFRTLNAGVMVVEGVNYTGLRVTANLKSPKGATISLFEAKPIIELAKPRSASTAGNKTDTRTNPDVSRGIDATPVVSSNAYTCNASLLVLRNTRLNTAWNFTRVVARL